MKKLINIISFAFIMSAVLLVNSCKEQDFTLSEKVVAFSITEGSISEDGEEIGIPVNAAATGGSGCTVTFEFDTEGIDNPAIEGEDFTVRGGSNTIDFSSFYGNDTIWIDILNNEVYDKNKSVNVVITSVTNDYKIAVENIYVLSIADDEHPLGLWLGVYAVAAVSYGDPGNWDEAWTVTSDPDPEDDTHLLLTGVAGSVVPLVAIVDSELGTIVIPKGQNLGDVYGLPGGGDITILGATADGSGLVDEPAEGTVNADGSISIDLFGELITSGDYAGYVWDVFNTSWTKQ